MTGKAYLVGSGPGGLGLLTIRAREVIDGADVVLYDQLPVRRSSRRSRGTPS
jgi:uroporphyrin-III C-methyltransferase